MIPASNLPVTLADFAQDDRLANAWLDLNPEEQSQTLETFVELAKLALKHHGTADRSRFWSNDLQARVKHCLKGLGVFTI